MKVFIDGGAYTGDTITKALQMFPDFDLFVGFEPFKPNFKYLKARHGNNPKVELHEAALWIEDGQGSLYLYKDVNDDRQNTSVGSTLMKDKKNATTRAEVITQVDLANYLKRFSNADYIVLKLDVEGAEYKLLWHLIDTKTIELVDKIYCEWHVNKIASVSQADHDKLRDKLNEFGFQLTGDSHIDEFYR